MIRALRELFLAPERLAIERPYSRYNFAIKSFISYHILSPLPLFRELFTPLS